MLILAYSPDQERDASGRFGSGGGAGGGDVQDLSESDFLPDEPQLAEILPDDGQLVQLLDDDTEATVVTKSDEIKDFVTRNEIGKFKSSLAMEEASAVKRYKGAEYTAFNEFLRGQKGGTVSKDPADRYWLKKTETMDKALEKAPPLKEAVTVFRGLQSDRLAAKMTPGATFSDKAFVSTSLKSSIANSFMVGNAGAGSQFSGEQQVFLKIRLPKGTKAAYLKGFAKNLEHEQEILLPRDSQFKVASVQSTKDGHKLVTVDYVGAKTRRLKVAAALYLLAIATNKVANRGDRFVYLGDELDFDDDEIEATSARMLIQAWSPDQERDELGRFGSGGSSRGSAGDASSSADSTPAPAEKRGRLSSLFQSIANKISSASAGGDRQVSLATRDARNQSLAGQVSLVKSQLQSLGVKDSLAADLQKSPALRSQAITNPAVFEKQIEHIEIGLKSALHFGGDGSLFTEKLAQIDRLKRDVAAFREKYQPETVELQALPDHFGKRGAGAINTKAAADHLAKGHDAQATVQHLMKQSGLAEATAKRYVRAAVKAAADKADAKILKLRSRKPSRESRSRKRA